MSTVTLTIGPKSYPVACADGEEAHIAALGRMIAEKYAMLGAARGPLEAQNLLFAALFLADELAEARKGTAPATEAQDPGAIDALRAEVERLESELAAARKAAAAPASVAPAAQADLFGGPGAAAQIAERLEALAVRAEADAAALEAVAANA